MRKELIAIHLIVAAGCTSSVEERRAGIIAGTRDTGDPAIVFLLLTRAQPAAQRWCTGTVISPHVVLVAAHCLDPSVIGQGFDQVQLFLGDDALDPNQAMNTALAPAVATTSFDPAFDSTHPDAGHDVGVVVTQDALSITPISYNRNSLDSTVTGLSARIVGYGQTSATDAKSVGIKFQMTATIAGVDDHEIWSSSATSGICAGDSGGPTLLTIDGVEQLVGVNVESDSADCVGNNYAMRTDVYAAGFIDPMVQMYDPGFLETPDMASPAPHTAGSPGCSIAPFSEGTNASALILLMCFALAALRLFRNSQC